VAFLTSEQKNALGPFLQLGIFLVAVCFGIAVTAALGGPRVPVISDFSTIVIGVVLALVLHKELSK
jgi:hypothetical protein